MRLTWKHKTFDVGVASNFAVIAASIRGQPVFLTRLFRCGLYSRAAYIRGRPLIEEYSTYIHTYIPTWFIHPEERV